MEMIKMDPRDLVTKELNNLINIDKSNSNLYNLVIHTLEYGNIEDNMETCKNIIRQLHKIKLTNLNLIIARSINSICDYLDALIVTNALIVEEKPKHENEFFDMWTGVNYISRGIEPMYDFWEDLERFNSLKNSPCPPHIKKQKLNKKEKFNGKLQNLRR
jgi:hypothetical protein